VDFADGYIHLSTATSRRHRGAFRRHDERPADTGRAAALRCQVAGQPALVGTVLQPR
jgi:hypothetical protein